MTKTLPFNPLSPAAFGLTALLAAAPVHAASGDVSGSASADASTAAAIELAQVQGADAVAAELQAQGYKRIVKSKTLLGRIRLEAESDAHTREIIVHQHTGEVLRDVVLEARGQGRGTAAAAVEANGATAKGQGNGLLNLGGLLGGGGNATADAASEGRAGGTASAGANGNGRANAGTGNGGRNGGSNAGGSVSVDVDAGVSVGLD